MSEIILASSSPTRAKILDEFAIKYSQVAVDFDEDLLKITKPREFVYQATKGKINKYLSQNNLNIPVICADTVVSVDEEILRKAKDADNAWYLLLKQSGNRVSILTCMIYKSKNMEFIDLSATKYLFLPFDKNKIEEYIKSDVWKDKAGACMVEGFCKQYIKEVVGLQSTAMGLSVEKLLPFLKLDNVL